MSTHSPTLGRCPRCESRISRSHVLIAYDTTDGPAAYAECPACRSVVHPV